VVFFCIRSGFPHREALCVFHGSVYIVRQRRCQRALRKLSAAVDQSVRRRRRPLFSLTVAKVRQICETSKLLGHKSTFRQFHNSKNTLKNPINKGVSAIRQISFSVNHSRPNNDGIKNNGYKSYKLQKLFFDFPLQKKFQIAIKIF
jgi:hypothetical protein